MEWMEIICLIFKNVKLICFYVQEIKRCAGGDLETNLESNRNPQRYCLHLRDVDGGKVW
jgi:hypothetical protein